MSKVKITNQRLWDISEAGENLDEWLIENVGYGNWTEYLGLTALPYRSFSFKDPKHETMFVLRWL